MSEQKAGASGKPSSEMDQTYVPAQKPAAGSGAKPAAAGATLDQTFVPEATAVNSRPAGEVKKATVAAAGSAAATGSTAPAGAAPKKASTSSLGKYKLLKKLGQGGMGEVFLGEDTKLGRKAAIKVLSKALAGKEDFVARFYKEARAMARVNHDNAVSVYDVDQDRGIHFVAMEFVDGKSMQKWVDELGKLSVGDALHVTLRCAEALQFAHSQNLIHRDIKPDNIMLTSKGKVKVADFGLAKATDEDLSMTASGTGLGTPFYMAPEQARNAKHVDGRADVYALGVTLYYFVTGKLPFMGDSALDVIKAKEAGRFESARKLNPQVTDKLDLMIGKMIDKDVNRRCKDCAEVIQLLSSMGLESPSLSFIEAPDRVVQSSAAAPRTARPASPAAATRVATPGVPRSSSDDAEAQARRAAAGANPEANTWIVQFKTPEGKETVSKFTTPQIQTALKTGVLNAKAKVKKNMADAFSPIGFFPDFEKALESRKIKEQADQKSAGLKSQFAKIGRQYDRRGMWRWIGGFASNTMGLIKLVIWLALVFGGIAALVLFRNRIWELIPTVWNAFANFMNSFQKS